jgi:hypothetical protein
MITIACFCGHTWRTSRRDDRCTRCGRTMTITTLTDAAAVNRVHHDSRAASDDETSRL